MTNPRIFWTSGRDHIDAMNRIGREPGRPVCGSAVMAYETAIVGDNLYCITIETHSLDNQNVMDVYLNTIDKQEVPA